MDSPLTIIVKLYGPIVLFIVLIVSSFTVKPSVKRPSRITVSLFIFSFGIPIANVRLARLLTMLMAFAVFGLYLVYDYSQFFPHDYSMQVFYDTKGINSCLSAYSDDQLKELNVPNEYGKYQELYYSDLDKEIGTVIST